MRRIPLCRKALFLIAFSLLGSAVAQAQCSKELFYADFKSSVVINTDPSLFEVLSPMTSSTLPACAGWLEMVVKINIPKDCTAAIIDTDYEGTPQAWTLNIGDSPTNNGFAGDAGTTVHNAELWILEQTLALANAGGSPGVIDNPLYFGHVSLTDSALKFLIKDQYVSWGQPFQSLRSPTNNLLFAIPDKTVDEKDMNSIYAGFNRVIYNGPAIGRTGCGLRTAAIRFE